MNITSNPNREELEKFMKAYNYDVFKQSMINVLDDAGMDMEVYDDIAIDSLALILIKNLIGEDKLNEYVKQLLPADQSKN